MENQKAGDVMSQLRQKVADAKRAVLEREEAERAAAAEVIAQRRRVEETMAARERASLSILEDWVRQFADRNIFIHIVGRVTALPFRLEISVGLLNSAKPQERCVFWQVVRARKSLNPRNIGIVFLPNRRFNSPDSLHDFLNDEFLSMLAEPLTRCSSALQQDPSKANSTTVDQLPTADASATPLNDVRVNEKWECGAVEDSDEDVPDPEELSGYLTLAVPDQVHCEGTFQVVYRRGRLKQMRDHVECEHCGQIFHIDSLHEAGGINERSVLFRRILGSLPRHRRY